ncbi:DEAD/DEAH box helicase family protein [Roseospirillum parvum]|uniref:Type I restriction enzyme, R subunit n=1 Tax=Roseospirillum parvum TaxID=83401 RepID=A0A1G8F376_9PROT|nr:DEAD/DEAH box helicase family protein [Roseospirillum parvum]SDH76574.1 type I restriction enzyme, R subunit [Roseospirillum parvum]
MKSTNFEFLRQKYPELASLAGFAEAYAYSDATSALVKLRAFAEYMTKDIYSELQLPKPVRPSFIDLLRESAFCAVAPKVVLDKLHALRMQGNKAAHGETAKPQTALWLLKEAHDLGRWLAVNFEKADPANLPAFAEPAPQIVKDQAETQRLSKRTLEKLAAQEAQLNELLRELDETRKKAHSAEKKVEELAALSASAQASADILKFDEATTRARIIDGLLASAGWDVGPDATSTPTVVKEYEVEDQPTSTGKGFVDYVLLDDDGTPLAVVEAKKTSVDPERGRKQAQLYADAIHKKEGIRPAIFYTNGYDIWLWDDVSGYPPRKVYGYYSKDSLQYLVKVQRNNRTKLSALSPQPNIVNRLYQLEAIKRVTERFEDQYRKSLLVQATGTGKTRVAIALAELLIRAGWAKRVLFLCDRRELRKQAKNAFTDFLPSEPIRIVNSRVSGSANERIFISTYPAMLKVHQSFDVGFFDLIIADESHRSIYNVYGDLFHYFDAMQVGLTATPVHFVTRSTFNLFNCEGQLPTANYDLEQAVEDGYLTPFEVFTHTTQFLREGIRLEGLTKEQIAELEEQGEDPSQYDFSSEQIDKAIYNKDTNRAILRNLMENGLRNASGQVIGKSIIFARNHEHAVLMSRLFDEMYPQYGGKFCQVIDNYDPRAEQLIDDFKGQGSNDKLTIAISVDMLDTGIDIPEILNLVFAKPVRSPVKFWQMVGRGTRLCPDLFGPGKDKTVFRIFDHWGNFERFEAGYQPAEPQQSKSLLQLLFEERLTLAETALRKSEVGVFDTVIKLIEADIADLPEDSVSVREKWRERRSALEAGRLKQFAPATVAMLRNTLAPLMQWRTTRGFGEAHAFDLLVARMQIAILNGTASLDDQKIEFFERLDRLQMHLNPVREKADVIKRAKSDEFWTDITAERLESVRDPLRQIIHYRDKDTTGGVPPKVIDVSEDQAAIQTGRRSTSLRTVDMKAYKQLVEAELRKHFNTNPVLKKIRSGVPVRAEDVQTLVSLVLTQNPQVTAKDLHEFFSATALPLDITIRSIVGLDPDAVKAKFSDFVASHPELTAKQTRFLGLLQNHIIKFGFITIDHLYDQPFTVVDADGPEGVFERAEDIDELMKIVNLFAPPPTGDAGTNTNERTQTP